MSRNEGKSGDSKYHKKSRKREKHNEANPSRDKNKKNEGFSENLLGSLKDRLAQDDLQMPGVEGFTKKADILHGETTILYWIMMSVVINEQTSQRALDINTDPLTFGKVIRKKAST